MNSAVRAPEPVVESTALPETVPALFQHTAGQRPDAAALYFKAGARWVPIKWKEYARAVNRPGHALGPERPPPGGPGAPLSANRPGGRDTDLGDLAPGLGTL